MKMKKRRDYCLIIKKKKAFNNEIEHLSSPSSSEDEDETEIKTKTDSESESESNR